MSQKYLQSVNLVHFFCFYYLQVVENHKILQQIAGKITKWEDLSTFGLELGRDPDDVEGLCTGTHSVKKAAYEILRSFYNQNRGPVWQMWRDIKDALESLGKKTAVRDLELDGLVP